MAARAAAAFSDALYEHFSDRRSSPPYQGLRIHARLCAGDPTAPADLAEAYFPWLLGWLGRHFPRAPADLRAEAAEDAVLNLMKRPETYAPGRGDLGRYLCMAAKGDLANLRRKERRHGRASVSLKNVELSPAAGKYLQRERPAVVLEAAVEEAERARFFDAVAAGLSPGERHVLDLLRRGERRTAAFAGALGLSHLPAGEQEAEVKRAKDRVKKRLRRAGGKP